MNIENVKMDSKLRLIKSIDTNLITGSATAISGALSQLGSHLLTSFGGLISN